MRQKTTLHFARRLPVLGLLATALLLAGCTDETATSNTPGLKTPEDKVTTYVYTAIPAGDGNSEYRLYPVYLPPERDIWWEAAVNALATYEPKKSGRYSTLWTKCALGKDVDKVTANADLITVHFRTVNPNLDLCALSPEAEEIRRQQLAWTMHDASNFDAPVVVTVGEDNTQVEGPFPAQEKYLGHLNTE